MTTVEMHDHEPTQFYWDAQTDNCPHKPIPERYTDAWDEWMTLGHQLYDDGVLCLSAPAGTACPACSDEDADMVPWSRCKSRDHARPARGAVPNPEAEHQPVQVWVGGIDCLERECDEYYTDDGDDDPTVDTCSHIREETVCSCRRLPDGDYDLEGCPLREKESATS